MSVVASGGSVKVGAVGERKERVVHARFSASELAAIDRAAEAAGLTVSAFMRSLTLEGAGVLPFFTDEDRSTLELLLSDMRAVGVNLNQLTRMGHRGGRLNRDEVAFLLADVQALVAAIIVELRTFAARGSQRRRAGA